MKRFIAFAILLAAPVYGAVLQGETQTPIAGTVVQYNRMPTATINNPLNQPPSIQMVTETVKIYPDGETTSAFSRRVNIGYGDVVGKKYPLYNPMTGVQVGTVDGDTLYALMYSTWILGERRADKQAGTLHSDPATICYTTSGADPVCKIDQ